MPETDEILPEFRTETYCASLDALPREESIRAIHAAYLQLTACGARVYAGDIVIDNRPAIYALRECLKKAGHLSTLEEG